MLKKILAIWVALLILLSATSYAFDKSGVTIPIGRNDEFRYVSVTTVGTAIGYVRTFEYDDDGFEAGTYTHHKTSFLMQGSGFVIEGGYVVTAAHVVHPIVVDTRARRYVNFTANPVSVINRVVTISESPCLDSQLSGGTPAEVIYENLETDIAILKLPEDCTVFDPVPYELAYTRGRDIWYCHQFSLINPGDAISMVVRQRDEEGCRTYNVIQRNGTVTSPSIDKEIPRDEVPWFSMDDISMDIECHGGDSGSPVFAFKNGVPVVIGVVRATNQRTFPFFFGPPQEPRAFAVRIDSLLPVINKK